MSDDIWRDRRDEDDFREFGSLFDDAEPTRNLPGVDDGEPADASGDAVGEPGDAVGEPGDEVISFGESDTGSLPHWTEPPTGDIPRLEPSETGAPAADDDEGLDVWSSFSSDAPVWKDDLDERGEAGGQVDDQVTEPHRPVSGSQPKVSASPESAPGGSGGGPRPDRTTGNVRRVTGESAVTEREPSRITIGTDPSGMPRHREVESRGRSGRGRPPGPGRAPRLPGAPPPGGVGGRDMPIAVVVGLVLAAAFIGVLILGALATAVLVTIVLGLAAVEFYDKVTEKGYRPAVVPGIIACVAGPVAAYWLGSDTLALTMSFAFMAIAGSFIGARSVEAGPLPNVSITTLAIVWIGLLGSFAMLILRFSTRAISDIPDLQALAENRGTDTLFLLALGVVANDIGALFIGSAVGKTPLRSWISPNKTVEGLTGGALFTILALQFVGLTDRSTTWSSPWHLLALGGVIAVMAPLGDLVESMFKRNLDIKDFGSIVRGHGGVLDRFDGFLFVLPAVYYLTLVLEPWTEFTPT